jgi:hypothetical protein
MAVAMPAVGVSVAGMTTIRVASAGTRASRMAATAASTTARKRRVAGRRQQKRRHQQHRAEALHCPPINPAMPDEQP